MNRIGIYFAYWERDWGADYSRYIRKVKALGFDTLEIAAGALANMSEEELREIAGNAKRQGVDLTYCMGLPAQYDVASRDESVRRNGVEYLKRLISIISFMGGDMLGGIIYGSWPGIAKSMEEKLRARERSLQSLREISKTAEDFGVTCCLEVVNRFEQYLLNTVDEGLQFVEELASPNIKLLLDCFHMNIEEDLIGDAICKAKGYVGHFHIGECNRKPPGNGHMPWDEILQALRDIDYGGRIVMEPFVKPGGEVGRDIKVYRDLSDNATEEEMDDMAKAACEFIRSKLSCS